MRDATLCFLIHGSPPRQVLLGLKKIGFGAGKYTGFGGKVQPGETPEAAAIRELEEEAGVQVHEKDLRPMGQFAFLFPAQSSWSQKKRLLATAPISTATPSRVGQSFALHLF